MSFGQSHGASPLFPTAESQSASRLSASNQHTFSSPRSPGHTSSVESNSARPISPLGFVDRSYGFSTANPASPTTSSNHGAHGGSNTILGSSTGASSSFAGSPFSTHANTYASLSSTSLGMSGTLQGGGKVSQSSASRADSFTSGQSPGINAPTSASTQAGQSGPNSGVSHSASYSSLHNFGEQYRTSSDHSRSNSGGAASNFSATSVSAANAAAGGPYSRRSHSPLPQTQSSLSMAHSPRAFGQQQQHHADALSPPSYDTDAHRKLSISSNSIQQNATSLLPPPFNLGNRPTLGRQSFSDGPPAGSALELGVPTPPLSGVQGSRNASFSGSFPSQDNNGHSLADLSSPSPAAPGSQTPTTGPLSASDPRTQLLVSNLPYRVRWQDLKDLFRKAGTVLRADVSLSADNRSRGFGTVLMATEQDAIKAAEMLGGFTWQGRTLDVRIDRSGLLVGVAGSAVNPVLSTGASAPGATASPITVPGQTAQGNPAAGFSNNSGSNSSFLGVPGNSGGQSFSPGHFAGGSSPSFGSSPSAMSPLAQAANAQSKSIPNPFANHPGSAYNQTGMSDLEKGFLQGRPVGNNFQTKQSGQANFGGAGSFGQQMNPALQPFLSSQSGSRRGSDPNLLPAPSSQLNSWNAGQSYDPTSGLYNQNSGGSSVPTGFPGATAMAPWNGGPGSFPGSNLGSVQSQPFSAQVVPPGTPTTSYAGRVLFVGNLPFHCQWQDLKDLFRAAGNIQRADVAIGPDGRSRGFGTVLFASQEDAQNAVRLYHGYEYSGRTLKVHFDRFAAQNGPAVGTPGNPAQYTGAFAAAALPSHMTNNIRPTPVPATNQAAQPGMQMFASQHQQQQQMLLGQRSGVLPFGMQQGQQQQSFMQGLQHQQAQQHQHQHLQQQQQRQQQQYAVNQQQQQHNQRFQGLTHQPSSFASSAFNDSSSLLGRQPGSTDDDTAGAGASRYPFGLFSTDSVDSRQNEGTYAEKNSGMSITLPSNGGFGAASSYLPSDLMSPGLVSPPPLPSQQSQGAHPGRIQLPPLQFGATTGSNHEMSPMSARMQIPMTPGMPGFSFQQVPQTPPLYPQFLSPGLGPFSPTIGGDPHASGAVDPHQNSFPGFMNAAPGAPLGFNPMFPDGTGQSSMAYAQRQQPATPHWSQPSGPRRGGALRQSIDSNASQDLKRRDSEGQAKEQASPDIAKTPGAGPRSRPPPLDSAAQGGPVPARRMSDVTPGGTGAVTPPANDGYPFPLVAPGISSHLTRRASTNSPAGSPMPHGPSGASSTSRRGSQDVDDEEQEGEGPTDRAHLAMVAGEALAANSAEELAKTIARLSVKGAALVKDANAKRSLSMTAERTAAVTAMAKLREQAGTPTATSPLSGNGPTEGDGSARSVDTEGLGAAFGTSDAASPTNGAESRDQDAVSRLRLGLKGLHNPGQPSPLASSQVAIGTSAQSANEVNERSSAGLDPSANETSSKNPTQDLFGGSVSEKDLEASKNSSALDTTSEPEGSNTH